MRLLREEDIGDHSFPGKFNIQFSMGKDECLDIYKGLDYRDQPENFKEFFITRRIKVKLPKTRVLEYNYEVIMRSIIPADKLPPNDLQCSRVTIPCSTDGVN